MTARSTVLIILFLAVAILFWNGANRFANPATYFTDVESESGSDAQTTMHDRVIAIIPPSPVAKNSIDSTSTGHYETLEETMARIKRDVNVTGTIMGVAGKEVAFFQIEGLPDQPFKVNTQLMDGFLITSITKDHVVLKNQLGVETLFLDVQ